MKDTKQIIEDCGIANTRAGSFLALIVSRKFTPFHADGAIEEAMGQIIGALYRRIEKLETDIDIAQLILGDPGALLKHILERMSGAQLLTLFMAGGVDTTLAKRIEKLEEEKECHVAEIKALESAVAGNAERIRKLEAENASFIKDLKLQSIRIAELEIWSDENQGL